MGRAGREHAAEQRLPRARRLFGGERFRRQPHQGLRPPHIKTGYYRQKAAKRQNQGNPFGTLNFGNDANNPLDSGYGFANAALGIFTSYAQASRFVEGELT